MLAGHANANTTDDSIQSTTTNATSTSNAVTNVGTTTAPVSAEDALNKHETDLKQRGEKFNLLRAAHMKEFQVN